MCTSATYFFGAKIKSIIVCSFPIYMRLSDQKPWGKIRTSTFFTRNYHIYVTIMTRLSRWRHKTQRNDAIPQNASHSRAGSRRRVQRFLRHSLYFDVTDDVETSRIRYAFNAKAARLAEKKTTSLKWPFGGDFPPIDSSTHWALQSEPGYKEIIHTRVATYGKYEDSSVRRICTRAKALVHILRTDSSSYLPYVATLGQ